MRCSEASWAVSWSLRVCPASPFSRCGSAAWNSLGRQLLAVIFTPDALSVEGVQSYGRSAGSGWSAYSLEFSRHLLNELWKLPDNYFWRGNMGQRRTWNLCRAYLIWLMSYFWCLKGSSGHSSLGSARKWEPPCWGHKKELRLSAADVRTCDAPHARVSCAKVGRW